MHHKTDWNTQKRESIDFFNTNMAILNISSLRHICHANSPWWAESKLCPIDQFCQEQKVVKSNCRHCQRHNRPKQLGPFIKLSHQVTPLVSVANLASRWRHLHWLQICTPEPATSIATLHYIEVKQLGQSHIWEIISPQIFAQKNAQNLTELYELHRNLKKNMKM